MLISEMGKRERIEGPKAACAPLGDSPLSTTPYTEKIPTEDSKSLTRSTNALLR